MAQAIKLETEAVYYFKLNTALSEAYRGNDATARFEAKDDMEVLEMYAHNPLIKARAARALAIL